MTKQFPSERATRIISNNTGIRICIGIRIITNYHHHHHHHHHPHAFSKPPFFLHTASDDLLDRICEITAGERSSGCLSSAALRSLSSFTSSHGKSPIHLNAF